MCQTPRVDVPAEKREGRGGGFVERDLAEEAEAKRRRREYDDDDNEKYDEYGNLKKKFRHRGGRPGLERFQSM